MRRIDLTGKRFGKLVVLEFYDNKWGGARWLCKCDCGSITIVSGSNLRYGHTTSCGCAKYRRFSEDLTGRKFGKLTVLEFDRMGPRGRAYWKCRCDCNDEVSNFISVRQDGLISGHTTSCGCRTIEALRNRITKHGDCETRLYSIWRAMKHRCDNSNEPSYRNYGGRGISVCDEWYDYETFRDWALDNGYDDDLSIDRIDVNDGYYPENCRWVDAVVQGNNRRNNRFITYAGETHTISEWARLFEVHYETLRHRINRGDMRDFEDYFGYDE